MKKIISTLLILTMLFAFAVPVYANEASGPFDKLSDAQIQAEIKDMEEMVWADLYAQLAAQDALDGIEYFKDTLRPQIEQVVYEKYNMTPKNTPKSVWKIEFPKGGLVVYDGPLNTEKSVLCMNPDDTKEYLWGPRVTLYKLLVAIIGTPLLSYANAVSIIMTAQARQEVIATDYYSKVLTISWGAGAEKGSYVYGWDTHPICYIYDSTKSPDVYYGV